MISTNAEESARVAQNFNAGTPLGGVASVVARVLLAAVGASPETTEQWTGIANAFGNLANSGLARRGSNSEGIVPARGGVAYEKPATYKEPTAGLSGVARAANDPSVFSSPGKLIDISRPATKTMLMQALWSGKQSQLQGSVYYCEGISNR